MYFAKKVVFFLKVSESISACHYITERNDKAFIILLSK